ncbi:MAG: sulfurtransferase-like selenium metabolism protein YedF [Hyphomicrobiales bacterium]
MNIIDTRGKLCPLPLIETRKALKNAKENEAFKVISDNEIAKNNVMRFLGDQNIPCECTEDNGIYTIVLQMSQSLDSSVVAEAYCNIDDANTSGNKYIVVISSDKMGEGDEDLGDILMKGFVNALVEQDEKPSHIIFYNSGVRLTVEGSTVLESLQSLSDLGIKVIVCGTCVDFFNIKDKVEVGIISNMFEITDIMTKASHIIKP